MVSICHTLLDVGNRFSTDRSSSTLDLEKEYYVTETVLGVGAFATVKLCVHIKTGEKCALKIIDKKKFSLNHGSARSPRMDSILYFYSYL